MPTQTYQVTVPVFDFGYEPAAEDLWEAAQWLSELEGFKVHVTYLDGEGWSMSIAKRVVVGQWLNLGSYKLASLRQKVLTKQGNVVSSAELSGMI